jgi:DNA-binding XRE family transcriptional regulator
MTEDSRFSSDGLLWAYNKYIRDDPAMVQFFEEELLKAEIAQQVYDARNHAGLTQETLADLVRTTPEVIKLIEESDYYEGDYLSTVLRIAKVLRRKVDVRFLPQTETSPSASREAEA